jgi:hypothetical protein
MVSPKLPELVALKTMHVEIAGRGFTLADFVERRASAWGQALRR